MTTPARRLFVVFWWLLLIGCVAFFCLSVAHVLDARANDNAILAVMKVQYHSPNALSSIPLTAYATELAEGALPFLLFVLLTVIRWVVAGRWRLGPRW